MRRLSHKLASTCAHPSLLSRITTPERVTPPLKVRAMFLSGPTFWQSPVLIPESLPQSILEFGGQFESEDFCPLLSLAVLLYRAYCTALARLIIRARWAAR